MIHNTSLFTMDYQKYTIKELVEKSANHELVLPNFQRDFVWKPEQQRLLLASLIVDLPIGNFLILEGGKNDFKSKELCFQKKAVIPRDTCLYLLDGQQRLSSVRVIFSDLLGIDNWKTNFDSIYSQLRNLWYIDLKEDKNNYFGFNNLKFKIYEIGKPSTIPLKTLEPTEILDCLKYNTVFKTAGLDRFFHPGQRFSGVSSYDKKLELAHKYAMEHKIPLFDILTEDKTIIRNCLRLLADFKKNSLIQKVLGNPPMGKEYLGHLDSSIEQKYQAGSYEEINRIWEQLKERWIDDFLEYFKDLFKADLMVPTVKANELPRATSVFEYMNKGGTPLDTFDIMVAKYAEVGEDDTLYDSLDDALTSEFEIPKELSESSQILQYKNSSFGILTADETITKPVKEQFLNFLCLINGIENKKIEFEEKDIDYIKKERILKLNREDIEKSLPDALKALQRSMAFLQFRCGIDSYNNLSYTLMLIPLGIVLKDDQNWNNMFVHRKLEFWYWTALFSGRFRERQNQRAITETKLLLNWVTNNDKTEIANRKDRLFEETNYCDEATLMLQNEDKSVPKAIHNGLLQYVLSLKPNDFTEHQNILRAWEVSSRGIKLQDHHIIPLGSAITLGQSSKELRKQKDHILNSPLNRTYISQSANENIRSLPINSYLPLLNKAVTYNHCLGSNAFQSIENKQTFYTDFVKSRFNAIKQQIINELSTLDY